MVSVGKFEGGGRNSNFGWQAWGVLERIREKAEAGGVLKSRGGGGEGNLRVGVRGWGGEIGLRGRG